MTRPDSAQKSSFLWQGLLILLPVAALAILGLSAITRDRAAVQEDARRRAHEILAQISEGLGRSAAEQLTIFDPFSYEWGQYYESTVIAWPDTLEVAAGRADRHPAASRTNEAARQYFETQLKAWNTAFPNLKPEEAFPLQFTFKKDGELDWPLTYEHAPLPPAWLSGLTPEQAQAWAALEQSEHDPARAGDLEGLVVRFVATHPPRKAQANAEFLRLRRETALQPAASGVTNLLAFARLHPDVRSPSGIPLSSLALADALNRAGPGGFTKTLWYWITEEVLMRPSTMTPQLLDRVEELTATNAPLAAAAAGLRKLWDSQEHLREMAQLIRESGKLHGATMANLWVENEQGRWLCLLNPRKRDPADKSQSADTEDSPATEANIFPQAMVERAFALAVRNSQIGVPDYFGLYAELEGEPLNLSNDSASTGRPAPTDQVLAEVAGVLTQPATLMVDPKRGEPLKTGVEFETMPGKPRFALQLALTDKNLLFAHQRQRQLIFGSVIALSAVAALVGFIAARRAYRRQLRLNELKSNFVSSVSHELRAPIASVRLMAESLERGKVSEPAKHNEYFRFIVQECRRLSGLIENVLDFSRIEQGRKQYEFEPTDLAAMASQTVKVMETYAAERNVTLSFEPAVNQITGNGYQANVDGRAIQQALVNLIDNAIKHSPGGGKVLVGLHAENVSDGSHNSSRVCLSVEDHGTGIAAAEHEKIFERFYRSGSELRRQTQGVGIGLSIVKHIVEAHGGRVVVRSEPGKGSKFTIELPARVEAKTDVD